MSVWRWIGRIMRKFGFLKYIAVIVLGVGFVGYIGDDCVRSHNVNIERMEELRQEIDYYKKANEDNMLRIERLESDPKAIEEVARAKYMMKRDDEDIFILSDER